MNDFKDGIKEKNDHILLASLEDKMRQADEWYTVECSNFLDMRELSLAKKLCKAECRCGYDFYGGYDEAERKMAVFFPRGLFEVMCRTENTSQLGNLGDAEDAYGIDDYFKAEPEANPLTLIRASLKKGSPSLGHRDYLGSLMGLGIRRDMIGDIIVHDDGADIVVMKEMADFLLINYSKAARANLMISEVPISQLRPSQNEIRRKDESVASLRLDAMISAAFRISRGRSAEAIKAGLVYVSDVCEKKIDKTVDVGDKLVLRGKGKANVKNIGRTTDKGRIIVTIDRYI